MSRVEFALAYLRKMIADKVRGKTYSKSNPSVIATKDYFDQIKIGIQNQNIFKVFSLYKLF